MVCSQRLSKIVMAFEKQDISPTKVLLNALILCLVVIPVHLLGVFGSPQQQGFYCNDDSLLYPLLPATISTTAVILGGLLIPIVTILIVESVKDYSEKQNDGTFIPWIISTTTIIGYFIFGCGCIKTITDGTKYSVGCLRPHFHAVCQTDWDSIKENCSNNHHQVYIYPIPCLNPDDQAINEAQLSFFSGHASFSAFTMIYLVFYLDHSIKSTHIKLFKPFIQFLCLLITVYISLSRVFDYHHHWSDVLFGFVIGAIMAYLIARYVSGIVKGNTTYQLKAKNSEAV